MSEYLIIAYSAEEDCDLEYALLPQDNLIKFDAARQQFGDAFTAVICTMPPECKEVWIKTADVTMTYDVPKIRFDKPKSSPMVWDHWVLVDNNWKDPEILIEAEEANNAIRSLNTITWEEEEEDTYWENDDEDLSAWPVWNGHTYIEDNYDCDDDDYEPGTCPYCGDYNCNTQDCN